MDELDQSLDYLTWITKATNGVREVLSNMNVSLPAVVAQGLGLAIAILILGYLGRGAYKATSWLSRLAQGVGALAALAVAVGIAHNWYDEWHTPPSLQVVGEVTGVPIEAVRLELLDYRGEPLGAPVERDRDSGSFSIAYSPVFADPPSSIEAQAEGCGEARRILLRRAHLKLGMQVSIQFDCGGSG